MFLLNRRGILNETDVIEYVKENSTTVLECPFKGIPGSISWLRYNNDMSELITEDRNVNPNIENIKVVGNHTIGEYNLELQRATKADEKIYKCVSNMNENLWVFEISVRLSTSNDEIKITNVSESNAVVGVIGISLTLKCISEHQYLSNISWSTNGNILCENHGNESAYEFIPREEHQNAIYTCTAVYIGKEIRKSVWLNLVPKSSELRYISTILETTKGEQETIAESSEKNHTIVTTVAIILVTAGILIAVYSLRNKGTENNSIMRDVNVAQEAQPGAQGNVQHNQNSSGLVYIEVDFEPKQEKSGPKLFYVHGSNNRSPYADIDFSAKADPLPESESDDNEIEEDDFVTLEDVKGWAIEISE
ncbi:unnamed protein product [Mytilus coruscus]|uniref:Ig-like domain-containing protein n=1 Tax=Mytilus coruscus TaxID=42192 RepID=A0A6J8BJI4_MYTCO|nr:unnamed protein product [Mytilus coruscus]